MDVQRSKELPVRTKLQRHISANKAIILLVAFVCLAIIGEDSIRILAARQEILDRRTTDAQNLTRSVVQQGGDTFQAADTALVGIVERLETDGTGPAALARLRKLFITRVSALPVLDGLFAYDEHGNWIVNSLPNILPSYNVADREYFQFHRTHTDLGPHLCNPRISRATGKWSVCVTRRYNHPDGSFAGITLALIPLKYFQDFYSTFDIGDHGAILLALNDGTVLTRYTFLEKSIGQSLENSPLYRDYLPKWSSGTRIVTSTYDGVVRLSSYRRSGRYSLVAVVAFSKDDIFAPWWFDAKEHLLFDLVLTAVIAALGYVLSHQIRRREQIEDVMNLNASLLRSVFTHTSDCVFVVKRGEDKIYRFEDYNAAAELVMGGPREQFIGKSLAEAFPPDIAAKITADFERCAEAGETTRYENYTELLTGGRYWDVINVPVADDTGQVIKIVSTTRDVTSRKLADEALRISEARYRLLAENSTDMIVRVDINRTRVYVSPSCKRLLGYERDEFLGLDNFAVFHPDDLQAVAKHIQELDRTTERLTSIYRLQHKDGHYVWCEIGMMALRDPDTGEDLGYVAVIRDVSARIEAEQTAAAAGARLAEANRLLLMAESMAHIGHWRVDIETRAMYWSEEVYKIYGLDPDANLDLEAAMLQYHPEDRDQLRERVRNAILHAEPYNIECRLIRIDGAIRDVSTTGQVEYGLNGKPVALIGTVQDITARKDAERQNQTRYLELQDSYQRLEAQSAALTEMADELAVARDAAYAASRAKSAFLATMSHELRTPLTGVLGMIDLLKSDPPPDQRNLFLTTLDDSAKALLTLLGDILDFSKIEAGQLVLENIDFDIRSTLTHLINLFSNAASAKGLYLRLAYTGSPAPDAVRSDPTRLRQIISNLISNAIKFTKGGSVTLRVHVPYARDGSEPWRFEVEDTGSGIEAGIQEQLFKAFTQADASVTRRFGGTGLGLAICKRLVEAMNGTIGVESTPGVGSRFWFTVPMAEGSADAIIREETAPPFIRQERSLRALVAEDNIVNQLLITALLEQMGHQARCAENGRLALEAVASGSYDVVLMDIQMPEMDGAAATRAIRAMAKPIGDIPIIALTADTVPEHIEFYKQAGFTEFLSKPINSAALQSALKRVIDNSMGDLFSAKPQIHLSEIAVFDKDQFDELRQLIGNEVMTRLLKALADETIAITAQITDAIRVHDLRVVGKAAHSLKGAAGNARAGRLAEAARRTESATVEGSDLTGPLAELKDAAEKTRQAIETFLNSKFLVL